MKSSIRLRLANLALLISACLALPSLGFSASTFEAAPLRFDVPAQPLANALVTFAEQAHVQLIVSADDLAGLRGGDVHGHYKPQAVLEYLLRQSGLDYRFTGADTVIIQRITVPAQN